MKHIFLLSITFYQYFVSPIIKNIFGVKSMCRYNPSCSSYAKESILKFGIIKGGKMAVIRIFNCQPFGRT